ncbi:hypothetical protein G4Y73_07140 [Wenzhouxiangella sp. XN201]|uniref:endonuclease n=1 Tax=Wenzhouxiangella sp. XN201 TaxID=2710755 RepID=UPI0013C7A0B4|nr:endonuclease [Wenzhouxiangella sp. XN201]NEZ03924.1 hypothetical protein [Wenzhouxiangella sp. XN201]
MIPNTTRLVARVRVTALFVLAVSFASFAWAQEESSYYETVDTSSPSAMRASLHAIIDDHTRYPYTSSSIDTWDILEIADEDQDNTGNVITVYRNASYAKQGGGNTFYNREHSWPKSYGFPNDGSSNYPYTDTHHLFIADSGYNSSRSNKPFDTCSSSCSEKTTENNNGRGGEGGGYPGDSNWTTGSYTAGTWEVWAGRRGDIARAMMYMDVRYEGGTHGITGVVEPDLVLTDDRALMDASNTGSNELVAYMGLLSVLLQWHDEDPVDLIEFQRNEAIASFQGNRNPFIDHPEWVDCVFRNQCDGTADTTPPAVPGSLTATGGPGHINLDWADNTESDLAGYNVYRSATSGGSYTLIGSGLVADSAYQDKDVTAGTTYFYVVTAVDFSSNESSSSNEASAVAQEGVAGSAWINEFHYDNDGTDSGEFVEVAGPAGLDLTGWSVVGYNGNGGTAYNSISLSGTIADQGGCTGTLAVDFTGLQNGAPDGIALIDNGGAVVEFISYEGTMTAADGPAAGMSSQDVGVSESASTPVGYSLQLGGTGSGAVDFHWQPEQADTYGQVNAGQQFDGCASDTTPPSAVSDLSASGLDQQVLLDWTAPADADLAGFDVYRATSSGGPYDQINGSLVTLSEFTDTSASNGTTYYYVVTAVDDSGNVSSNSNEASATPQAVGTGGVAWINELHYDNESTDVGEFVEIAAEAGLDLNGWQLVAYNGNGGAVYDTLNLSGTVPDLDNGFGVLAFDLPGLQNGSPDGIALVDGLGDVVEFLSYEGSFTAVDGAANGMSSVDILVSETSSTPIGWSLQRTGTGQTAAEFSWADPQADTYGSVNAGQSFGSDSTPVNDPPAAPTGLTATADHKRVELTWDANGESDLAGYRLYRSQQSGGSYQLIASLDAADTAYSDTGLQNDQTYYYVLTAVDSGGLESTASSEVSAVPAKGSKGGGNGKP